MSTVKTCIVAACCGLMLLGAVSAYAGLGANGVNPNGLGANGINPNGLGANGINCNPTPEVQSQGLPFNGLSHRGLGKTHS